MDNPSVMLLFSAAFESIERTNFVLELRGTL